MRFVNPWIFFYDLLLYYVSEKKGGGAKSVCGFEDPFSNSHTEKRVLYSYLLMQQQKQIDDLERCGYDGHHIILFTFFVKRISLCYRLVFILQRR